MEKQKKKIVQCQVEKSAISVDTVIRIHCWKCVFSHTPTVMSPVNSNVMHYSLWACIILAQSREKKPLLSN